MNIDPIVLSIPVFFTLIGIELLVERFTHQKLYRLPDAISHISYRTTSQLSGLFLNVLGIGSYCGILPGQRKWVKWAERVPGSTPCKDNTFRWLGIALLTFCFSCDKPLPTLEGMDLEKWRQDKDACQNMRRPMRDAIESQKEKLLALDQMQVVKLLGKPDVNELSSRNQKFFYYFLEPAHGCGVAADSGALKLVIRFNAVGLAKEVALE